jgi:hypothetical protein
MTDNKPKVKNMNSASERELDKVKEQFDNFDAQVKEMTMDRMSEAPKLEAEPQTKMSQNELAKSKDIYLKPDKVISCREKFNEKYREDFNFGKEYVQFVGEHKELIGENIEIWTKPFAGVPAEYWIVPTNKPVWGPRYLAEQIKRKSYHRLTMKESADPSNYVGSNGAGAMYGKIVADTTIQRIDATPVSKRKSVFMGGNEF